eukprot:173315-Pyramimonas_sp.AAC.1
MMRRAKVRTTMIILALEHLRREKSRGELNSSVVEWLNKGLMAVESPTGAGAWRRPPPVARLVGFRGDVFALTL